MDTETMIRNLKKVEEDHRNDKVLTGQLCISDMAHDVREKIEELRPYEDTGLTPEQIRELKERDTAKSVREADCDMGYYICPGCGASIGYMEDGYTSHKFCLNCGQRLKWED